MTNTNITIENVRMHNGTSEDALLFNACVTAARAGRVSQVAELVRHFSDEYKTYRISLITNWLNAQ